MKSAAKLLIIDDHADVALSAKLVLSGLFSHIRVESDPHQVRRILEKESFDAILMDMNYTAGATDGKAGLNYLRRITDIAPSCPVVLMTAFASVQLAVEAMRCGANDFVIKPWDNKQLIGIMKRILGNRSQHSTPASTAEQGFYGLIGRSATMQEVYRTIRKVAVTDANVLVTGENGTGKELVAKALHDLSLRSERPFVSVDMGAIPASLFESELFGYRKGAFTDAREDRPGKFQLASGGTLFMDEIGNLDLSLQAKLLHTLQTRTVTPLGGDMPIPVNIRLICATNANPGRMVEEKTFRQDLLYRINTIEIHIPPLRERREDIREIALHYAALYSGKYKTHAVTISAQALDKLMQYHWPGNVRELQHALERAVILCEGEQLQPDDFILQEPAPEVLLPGYINLEEMEKQAIYTAIKKHNGNLSQAARELGLGRTTLYRKMEKYGL